MAHVYIDSELLILYKSMQLLEPVPSTQAGKLSWAYSLLWHWTNSSAQGEPPFPHSFLWTP